METRYRLEVRLAIVKEERSNPEQDYWRPTQERLSVEENLTLDVEDFAGVARVLVHLHDAVAALPETVAP